MTTLPYGSDPGIVEAINFFLYWFQLVTVPHLAYFRIYHSIIVDLTLKTVLTKQGL